MTSEVHVESDPGGPCTHGDVPAGLLRHLDTAVCAVAADGTITHMSSSVVNISGLEPSHYVGTKVDDHVHPADAAAAAGEFRRLLLGSDGTRGRFHFRSPLVTGEWHWVDLVATRRLDDPTAGAIVASIRDVETEHLDAERREESVARSREQIDYLEHQETFLKSVIEATADAVVITDGDLRVRWVSPSTESFSGWTLDTIAQRTAADLVHPDDLAAALDQVGVLLKSGLAEAEPALCRVLMADGAYRWVTITGRDLRDVPWIHGLVLVFTDVHDATEARLALEASERRFEALVRNSNDCMVLTDAERVCRYMSPALTRILGWEPAHALAAPFADGVPEPDRLRLIQAHDAAIADPSRPVRVEARFPHAAGGFRDVEVVFWSRLDDPDVAGVIGNFRDVTDHRRLVAELEARTEVLRSLAFSSTTGLFEQDSEHGTTFVNERWVEITGLSAEEAMGDGWRSILVGQAQSLIKPVGEAEVGEEQVTRLQIRRPDGQVRWIDLRATVLPPDAQGVVRRLGGIEDVTAVVEAEEGRHRLADVFDATDDLVVLVDSSGAFLYANEAARGFLGEDLHRLSELAELVEVGEEVAVAFYEQGLSRWSGEVGLRDPSGELVPMSLKVLAHRDERGVVEYYSAVARDITERIELEGILERQATHDPLTGLPNRALLFERIHAACGELTGSGHPRRIALLFVDLDHFKVINDSLGHSLGDRLLRSIAERILTVTRPGDTVARFGGDEFVVLCEHLERPEEALAVAHRVEGALQTPFLVDGHEIHVGVSIGIAHSDPREPDAVAMLRDADTAMYEAKSAGRGRWVVFDDDLRKRAVDRQRTETALRRSRHGDDLELHFQPVLDLRTRTLRGVEALLRWRNDGSLVRPDEFVSIAEETGLIVPIGTWVLREACSWASHWQRLPGWSDLGVAVNVSARQLQRPGFLHVVSDVLAATGVDPVTLTVEITESVLLDDTSSTAAALQALRDLGVHVAVDDFGTGYSSLTYLHSLPVDVVKLDRSFVAGVADDVQKRAIVTAVINLAKALGLQSVAEGIETERQLAELAMLGCVAGQGHLISEAVEPHEITKLLAEGSFG